MRELNKLFIFLLFNYFYISEVKCGGCVVEPPLNDDSPQIGKKVFREIVLVQLHSSALPSLHGILSDIQGGIISRFG